MRKTYWNRRPLNLQTVPEPVREPVESRVLRYLGSWPEGLSSSRMAAWVASCSRGGGYTEKEFYDSLRELRDSGRIAIANGIWYLRGGKTECEIRYRC